MMDFDQFEYRMMVNYAREIELIEKIKSGLDVHTATAEMMNVTRKQAKTLNFLLLYGGGAQVLADKLGLSNIQEAYELKRNYFQALPAISNLFTHIMNTARTRGNIKNGFGRVYHFDPDFAYKAANYLIQGTTADWIKFSMVRIDEYLRTNNFKSHLLLQIHDELLFEVHESETHIIPILKGYMQNVSRERPHDLLPYTVGIDYSTTSWKDKKEWHL
jgi:DNA polymerase-1